jgi:hypothetical protein
VIDDNANIIKRTAVYAGFPAALNGLSIANEVLDKVCRKKEN